MIRLIESLASNYCNIAKVALLEKSIEFAEVAVTPDGRVLTRAPGPKGEWSEEAFTADHQEEFGRVSPAGKVPVLDVDGEAFTETSAILEYLEDAWPSPALLPREPLARARVRELMRHMELYVELPARRLGPGVFYGQEIAPEEKSAVRPLLEQGFRSVSRLARFDPYIAGSEFSFADLYAHRALGPAGIITKTVYGWDAAEELEGLTGLIELLDERESFRRVEADLARQ